jgi:subtilisin family serine protease
MMKHHALLYALLLVLLVAVVASEGVVRDYQRSLEQDTWVIHVEEGVDIESVEIQLLAYGLTIISYPLDRLIMAEESGLNNVETESIAAINGVIAVSQNRPVYFESTWNQQRISQRNLPLSGSAYNPLYTGFDVPIYIVDTGVAITHPEFNTGRATNMFTAFGTFADGHGHGTHVAGIAAGLTYGVAPGAKIFSVRVLDDSGSGSTFTVGAGLNHIIANGEVGIINLSLGYSGHDALLQGIVANATAKGFIIVAAVGNSEIDACGHEPSAFAGVVSCAASDRNDLSASFNNFGPCVTAFAPGVDITSANKNGGSISMSGTSMSTPHFAGAFAQLVEENPGMNSTQLKALLLQRATSDVLMQVVGSPNVLLYVGPVSSSSTVSATSTRTPSTSLTPSATRTPSTTRTPSSSASTASHTPTPSTTAQAPSSSAAAPTSFSVLLTATALAIALFTTIN